MRKLARFMLVAGLVATVAGPSTFLSGRDANATETPGRVVARTDDAGPVPGWWGQALSGESSTPNAAQGTDGPAVVRGDDAGPLPGWYAGTVYGESPIQAEHIGVATGPARTATDGVTPQGTFDFSDGGYANQ